MVLGNSIPPNYIFSVKYFSECYSVYIRIWPESISLMDIKYLMYPLPALLQKAEGGQGIPPLVNIIFEVQLLKINVAGTIQKIP